jgi:hypothetical protein
LRERGREREREMLLLHKDIKKGKIASDGKKHIKIFKKLI